jgi:site-specific DNA-methyltransferase (adenine-specific)
MSTKATLPPETHAEAQSGGGVVLQRLVSPYFEDEHVTIYHGDARLILPALGEGWADAIVSDPPYGINLQPQRGKTKAIQNDGRREAKALWWAVTPLLAAAVKQNTASLMFGGWSEAWASDVLREWFTVKGCIVWKKNQWGIGYYLRPQWELAWYLHKGEPPVPENAVSDVWEAARESAPEHSCQKPLPLMQRAIQFTGGRVILDPFAGSGSTLLAAKNLGLRAVGIEIAEEHCELIARRCAQGALL